MAPPGEEGKILKAWFVSFLVNGNQHEQQS
jgi:hypothetical protein